MLDGKPPAFVHFRRLDPLRTEQGGRANLRIYPHPDSACARGRESEPIVSPTDDCLVRTSLVGQEAVAHTPVAGGSAFMRTRTPSVPRISCAAKHHQNTASRDRRRMMVPALLLTWDHHHEPPPALRLHPLLPRSLQRRCALHSRAARPAHPPRLGPPGSLLRYPRRRNRDACSRFSTIRA